MANAGPDQVLECTGDLSALAKLDASGSTDPDGDEFNSFVWYFQGTNRIGPIHTISFPLGSHEAWMQVWDRDFPHQLMDRDTTKIDVVDRIPPTLTITEPTPRVLWPPNGALLYIDGLEIIEASDVCDPNVRVDGFVVSSEPDDATGIGDRASPGDIRVWRGGTLVRFSTPGNPVVEFSPRSDRLQLRAERAGRMRGRTYTITVVARDKRNENTQTFTVAVVPHDRRKK